MIPQALIPLLLAGSLSVAGELPRLILHKAIPVTGPKRMQPSGLTMFKRQLYTVSDKHSKTVFRLEFGKNSVRMVPHLTFEPPGLAFLSLDFEGICADSRGNFYLASERKHDILRVEPSGKASWVGLRIRPKVQPAGLLQKNNAGLEGICRLPNDRSFILCAEREPRGLITVEKGKVTAQKMNSTVYPLTPSRPPDFAGLCLHSDKLYALHRNAYVVGELVKDGSVYREGKGWSFAHVATAPAYRYRDMRFGTAEGLAMDKDFIYLILDNNGDSRTNSNQDKRPLLFIFKQPKTKE